MSAVLLTTFSLQDLSVQPAGKRDFGDVRVTVQDLRWGSFAGSAGFRSPFSGVYLIYDEVGGHSEFDLEPIDLGRAHYHEAGRWHYVPADMKVFIHSHEMREARLAFVGLTGMPQAPLRPRLDMMDPRVAECASLLAAEVASPTESKAYGHGLASAFGTALATALAAPAASRRRGGLNAAQLNTICGQLNDLLDQTVGTSELASMLGMSEAQLSRAFIRSAGMPVQRWQMHARICWVQRLLVDAPETSLREISGWTGFADQSHLSRVFRQIVGVTPSAWLRQRT